MQGWGDYSGGKEEAQQWTLLQQDAFLPAGQAPAPSLGFRVSTYWKGQNNTFVALEMDMPTAVVPDGGL